MDDGHGKGAPGGMLEFPAEKEVLENLLRRSDEAQRDLEFYLNTRAGQVAERVKDTDRRERSQARPMSRRPRTLLGQANI